jgi:hypothetical protein
MLQDSVVAIVPDEAIRDVLPAVHRAGLGHLARLVRAGKRSVVEQLQRAAVPVSQAPPPVQATPVALLISAAARAPMAASLLLQHGATTVWTVSASGAWTEIEDIVLVQPNVHELPPHPARQVPGRDNQPGAAIASSPLPAADMAD